MILFDFTLKSILNSMNSYTNNSIKILIVKIVVYIDRTLRVKT